MDLLLSRYITHRSTDTTHLYSTIREREREREKYNEVVRAGGLNEASHYIYAELDERGGLEEKKSEPAFSRLQY